MTEPRKDPSSWGALRTELHRQGATLLRTRGSHEVWRTRNGRHFVVVRSHLNEPVPLGIRVRFRRLHGRGGASEGDEPLLLARSRGVAASSSRERKGPDRVKESWKRQSSRKWRQQGRLERQLRPWRQRKLGEERRQ